MKSLIIISVTLLLSGCSYFNPNVKTVITLQDGNKINVSSKPDSFVVFKTKDEEISVDLRGRPSLFEMFISAILMRGSGISSQPNNTVIKGN